jgi:hypothetical protein
MKKLLIMLVLLCVGLTSNAQNYTREGNTFVSVKSAKAEPTKTKFTWKDSKGTEYPVYISSTGSCFIIRISKKTGKEYRSYLGPEVSAQICKELNIEYKGKKGNKS